MGKSENSGFFRKAKISGERLQDHWSSGFVVK